MIATPANLILQPCHFRSMFGSHFFARPLSRSRWPSSRLNAPGIWCWRRPRFIRCCGQKKAPFFLVWGLLMLGISFNYLQISYGMIWYDMICYDILHEYLDDYSWFCRILSYSLIVMKIWWAYEDLAIPSYTEIRLTYQSYHWSALSTSRVAGSGRKEKNHHLCRGRKRVRFLAKTLRREDMGGSENVVYP